MFLLSSFQKTLRYIFVCLFFCGTSFIFANQVFAQTAILPTITFTGGANGTNATANSTETNGITLTASTVGTGGNNISLTLSDNDATDCVAETPATLAALITGTSPTFTLDCDLDDSSDANTNPVTGARLVAAITDGTTTTLDDVVNATDFGTGNDTLTAQAITLAGGVDAIAATETFTVPAGFDVSGGDTDLEIDGVSFSLGAADLTEAQIASAIAGTDFTLAGSGAFTGVSTGDDVTFTRSTQGTSGNGILTVQDGTYSTFDTTAPATPTEDTAVATPTNDNTPEVTIGFGETGGTFTIGGDCTAQTGTVTGTTQTITLGTTGDNDYTCTVTQTDGASNTSTALTLTQFTVDTTSPATPTENTAVTTPTNDDTPEVTIGFGETGGTFTIGGDCTAQTGTVTGTTQTITLSALADGDHTCTVTQTDGASNTSTALTLTQFTVDTTAPATPTEDTAVATPTNDNTPEVTIGFGETGGTFTIGGDCTTQTGTVTGTTQTITLGTTGDNDYTCTVTQTDGASNTSTALTLTQFTVDTTSPATPTENTAVTTPTNDDTPEVTIGFGETGGTFTIGGDCTAQTGTVTGTTQTITLGTTGDNDYTCTVTQTDGASNTSTALTLTQFTVDTTSPATPTENTAVTTPTNDDTPEVTIGFGETGGTFTIGGDCTAQTGTVTGTTQTITLSALADGDHTCTVTQTDGASNTSTALTLTQFTVDTTSPATPTEDTAVATPTNDNTPEVTIGFGETGGTFTIGGDCTTQTGTVTGTTQTITLGTTGDNDYTCTVTQTDGASNTSTALTLTQFTVDTTSPATPTENTAVTTPTNDDTPEVTIGFGETGGTFTIGGDCTAQTGTVTGTTQTITLGTTGDNDYTCTVTQTDGASNTSTALTLTQFTVDTTSPATPTENTAVTTPTNDDTPEVTIGFGETGGTFTIGGDCTAQTGTVTGTTQTITLSALADGDHTCTVTQTDGASNTSTTLTLTQFTVDTTAPTIAFDEDIETGPVQSDTININTNDGGVIVTEDYVLLAGPSPTCDATVNFAGSTTYTDETDFVINTEANNGNYICARVVDTAGNAGYLLSGNDLNIDVTAPSLTTVTIQSDNANPVQATTGDIITIIITANEAITTPDITIAGQIATVIGSGTGYTATYTVQVGDTQGPVAINISNFNDTAGNGGGAVVATTNSSTVNIDTQAPTLTQITPIPNPTSDTSPDYIFSSSEMGTITYGGSCSSTMTNATSGNNTITFNPLALGTYSDCTIIVTDAVSNASAPLAIQSFTIEPIMLTGANAPTIETTTNGNAVNIALGTPTDPTDTISFQYGLDGFTQTETDLIADNLRPCTNYDYNLTITDTGGGTRSTNNQTLTTGGCLADATVQIETKSNIALATGGTLTLDDGDQDVTFTIPAGVSTAATAASFQIKRLTTNTIANAAPFPRTSRVIGGATYDFSSTHTLAAAITSFAQPITVEIQYTDGNVEDNFQSTLRLYRWNGTQWVGLPDCTVDTNINTVSCQTTQFSSFALLIPSSFSARNTISYRSNTNQSRTTRSSSKNLPVESSIPIDTDSEDTHNTQRTNIDEAANENEETNKKWQLQYRDKLIDQGGLEKADTANYNQKITRQEFSKLIARAFELQATQTERSFEDIGNANPNKQYIEALKEAGIVQGQNGKFYPNRELSRVEALKILFLAAGVEIGEETQTEFEDIERDTWYAPYVAFSKENGIVKGFEDGLFRPNKGITKAEAWKIVSEVLDI